MTMAEEHHEHHHEQPHHDHPHHYSIQSLHSSQGTVLTHHNLQAIQEDRSLSNDDSYSVGLRTSSELDDDSLVPDEMEDRSDTRHRSGPRRFSLTKQLSARKRSVFSLVREQSSTELLRQREAVDPETGDSQKYLSFVKQVDEFQEAQDPQERRRKEFLSDWCSCFGGVEDSVRTQDGIEMATHEEKPMQYRLSSEKVRLLCLGR